MGSRLDFIQRSNADYIEEQYARYRRDPASVGEEWALFFAGFDLAGRADALVLPGPAGGAASLVRHHRVYGHLSAHLDPLSGPPPLHPLLEPASLGLSAQDLDAPVDPSPFRGEVRGSLRDLVAALRATYCGPLGVEYMQIADEQRRAWLEERMEPVRNRPQRDPEERIRILKHVMAADAFEEFLHVRYVGQKRFSLEGATSLIPMLDCLIETAAAMGVEQVVIGMPHRGRLNVLAHVLHKPLEMIFQEFESTFAPEEVQGHGDVKYHMGYSSLRKTRNGRTVHLDLNFNPSHLEFVNPVVLGAVRARQDSMRDEGRDRGIPVLLHGDAAFSGEGIVPETLALAGLPPYHTGGTIHVVINNQIGFTTSPEDVRMSRYATDVARGEDAPVFHVNGDDPEAAVRAIRLAAEYRAAFRRDVFVDLICYRKHGHNELDDPTFTQPVMYRAIAAHAPAARRYAAHLIEEGVLDALEHERIGREIAATLKASHQRVRSGSTAEPRAVLGGMWTGLDWAGDDWSAATAVSPEMLARIARDAARLPDGFHPHRKVQALPEARIEMVEEDRIDWGTGEVLAVGSILLEGKHVRLSGQDTSRGTFSHRHAVLRDVED